MDNIKIQKLKLNESGTRESAEDMTLFFLEPLMDSYGVDNTKELFIQCMSAYDLSIGCIYILSENNRPLVFAFIFDKYDTIDSAPHLHIFSVYKSRQRHGYGSILMSTLVNQVYTKSGLTLECKKDSIPFFKKHGFSERKQSLDNYHISMYTSLAKNKPRFKIPITTVEKRNDYMLDYETCLERLISKNMCKVSS